MTVPEQGDQLDRQVDLAHADGIQPEHIRSVELGDQFGRIESEALAETLSPLTPSQHFEHEQGRGQDQKDSEEHLVARPNQPVHDRGTGGLDGLL